MRIFPNRLIRIVGNRYKKLNVSGIANTLGFFNPISFDRNSKIYFGYSFSEYDAVWLFYF